MRGTNWTTGRYRIPGPQAGFVADHLSALYWHHQQVLLLACALLVLALLFAVVLVRRLRSARRIGTAGGIVWSASRAPVFLCSALAGWIPALAISSVTILLVVGDPNLSRLFAPTLGQSRRWTAIDLEFNTLTLWILSWGALLSVGLSLCSAVWWRHPSLGGVTGRSRCGWCGYEAMSTERCPECGGRYANIGVIPGLSRRAPAGGATGMNRLCIAVACGVFCAVTTHTVVPLPARCEVYDLSSQSDDLDPSVETVVYLKFRGMVRLHTDRYRFVLDMQTNRFLAQDPESGIWHIPPNLVQESHKLARSPHPLFLRTDIHLQGWLRIHQGLTGKTRPALVPMADEPMPLRRLSGQAPEVLVDGAWERASHALLVELIQKAADEQGFIVTEDLAAAMATTLCERFELETPEPGKRFGGYGFVSVRAELEPWVYVVFVSIGILGGVGGWRGSRWLENRLERW